jgi:uncharacterized protein YqgC (DUF456 family)
MIEIAVFIVFVSILASCYFIPVIPFICLILIAFGIYKFLQYEST